MPRYDFLVDSYRTERVKTLAAWSQVPDGAMDARPEPRARTPREHMVHQCASEDGWMRRMLDVAVPLAALPAAETRLAFLEHYAAAAAARAAVLDQRADAWWEADVAFFDVPRSRAWILTRRLTHSAHHRGQLLAQLRALGVALYSTYGPTADTGGLPGHGAAAIYRYPSAEALLAAEASGGGGGAPLPGPGPHPPTERPGGTPAA